MDETKKVMSDLKFSDFQSAGIQFNHDADDMFGSFNIGEEEAKDMATALQSVVRDEHTISKIIEATLLLDVPTKWKVVGLLKLGQAMQSGKVANILKDIPDEMPGMLVKASVLLGMLGGRG